MRNSYCWRIIAQRLKPGGFNDDEVVEERAERNAPHVLLFLRRPPQVNAVTISSNTMPAVWRQMMEKSFFDSFFLIAGPCVIESPQLAIDTAGALKEICFDLGIAFIFKSSYDKANRSSGRSYRGLGLDAGLKILAEVRQTIGVPILTDVHDEEGARAAADVVDVLQTPAFLCRQTDFVHAVARLGRPVNFKKGQFLAPGDMKHVIEKAREAAREAGKPDDHFMVCERGASFGYNNLVSDMRSLAIMREIQCPVVFDATHSVQLPGGQGDRSGGQRQFVPVLARAAVAAGVSGLFMETHPDPDRALSDGPNSWPLARMRELLTALVEIDAIVKSRPFPETDLLAAP